MLGLPLKNGIVVAVVQLVAVFASKVSTSGKLAGNSKRRWAMDFRFFFSHPSSTQAVLNATSEELKGHLIFRLLERVMIWGFQKIPI